MNRIRDELHRGVTSILQISDTHIMSSPDGTLLGVNTAHYFGKILRAAFAARSRFDLVLLTGDLAQEPVRASYQHILNSLGALGTPCICLPGNHDDYELMQQIFNTQAINCRKHAFVGNWQLVSLNSQIPGEAGGHVSDPELSFLEQCLRENADRHTLVAVHHHCVPTDSPWMDSMITNNSQALLEIIHRYSNVKLITTGHIHQVLDKMSGSVRVLGAPSTCFQFSPKTPVFSLDTTAPGYRTIDLHADGHVETEVIRLPGELTELQRNTGGY